MDDAIYNFSRVYQQYAQQGDVSDEEMVDRAGSCSASDEDRAVGKTEKQTQKKRNKGFEKVTLLVGSDEEEIF